jgi:hypothetical protein
MGELMSPWSPHRQYGDRADRALSDVVELTSPGAGWGIANEGSAT